MPSLGSKTWARRLAKLRASGKVRKRKNRRGTTPAFAIHLDSETGPVQAATQHVDKTGPE